MSEVSNTPEGVLVRLKTKILIAAKIDSYKLKLLIDKFVISNANGVVNSQTHFARVNIFNAISKPRMSIKIFFRFLKVINIKHVKLSVTITTAADKEITVTEDINLFTSYNDDGQD